MNDLLEYIGLADYGIIKSLNYINRSKCHIGIGDPNQTFKNIYMHFNLALENVQLIAKMILRIKDGLGLDSLDKKSKLSSEDIEYEVKKFVCKRYDRGYENWLNKGKPISISLHQISPPIKGIISGDLWSKFKDFKNEMGLYRNNYVHNPCVDLFGHKGYILVPGKEMAKNYPKWTDMKEKAETSSDGFENPFSMINSDYSILLDLLNRIYGHYISEYRELMKNKSFKTDWIMLE